jgi:hypothetical protein
VESGGTASGEKTCRVIADFEGLAYLTDPQEAEGRDGQTQKNDQVYRHVPEVGDAGAEECRENEGENWNQCFQERETVPFQEL